MGKKRVKKTAKSSAPKITIDAKQAMVRGTERVLIDNLLIEANTAMLRIGKLEQRFDRLIRALDKSKSVRGL